MTYHDPKTHRPWWIISRRTRPSPSHNLRFCHGFNTSLIQIHRDSPHFSIMFTIGSIVSHFSHDVPYVQSKSATPSNQYV